MVNNNPIVISIYAATKKPPTYQEDLHRDDAHGGAVFARYRPDGIARCNTIGGCENPRVEGNRGFNHETDYRPTRRAY